MKEKPEPAEKTISIWKKQYEKLYERFEELKKEIQPYLDAGKLAPEKVRAFLYAVLTRRRDTKNQNQSVRHKQDMERKRKEYYCL